MKIISKVVVISDRLRVVGITIDLATRCICHEPTGIGIKMLLGARFIDQRFPFTDDFSKHGTFFPRAEFLGLNRFGQSIVGRHLKQFARPVFEFPFDRACQNLDRHGIAFQRPVEQIILRRTNG